MRLILALCLLISTPAFAQTAEVTAPPTREQIVEAMNFVGLSTFWNRLPVVQISDDTLNSEPYTQRAQWLSRPRLPMAALAAGDTPEVTTAGGTDPVTRTITLSSKWKMSELVHEVRHYQQLVEGMPRTECDAYAVQKRYAKLHSDWDAVRSGSKIEARYGCPVS